MPGLVAYTNARGGSTCPAGDGRLPAVRGEQRQRRADGPAQPAVLGRDRSRAERDGRLASEANSTRSRPNATRGQSAQRGGSSSGSSYGEGMRRGIVVVGLSGSWSAPLPFALGRPLTRGRLGQPPISGSSRAAPPWVMPRLMPGLMRAWCSATWPTSTATGCPTRSRSTLSGGCRCGSTPVTGSPSSGCPGRPRRVRGVRRVLREARLNGGVSFATPAFEFAGGALADREGRLRPLHLERRQRRWHPRRPLPRRRGRRGAGAGAVRHRCRPVRAPQVYGATGEKSFDFVGDWDPGQGLHRPAGPPRHLHRLGCRCGLHGLGAAVRADPRRATW